MCTGATHKTDVYTGCRHSVTWPESRQADYRDSVTPTVVRCTTDGPSTVRCVANIHARAGGATESRWTGWRDSDNLNRPRDPFFLISSPFPSYLFSLVTEVTTMPPLHLPPSVGSLRPQNSVLFLPEGSSPFEPCRFSFYYFFICIWYRDFR
jgi:hypothetical protein